MTQVSIPVTTIEISQQLRASNNPGIQASADPNAYLTIDDLFAVPPTNTITSDGQALVFEAFSGTSVETNFVGRFPAPYTMFSLALISGTGTNTTAYVNGEQVTGQTSGSIGFVRSWTNGTGNGTIICRNRDGFFEDGELVVGATSGAARRVATDGYLGLGGYLQTGVGLQRFRVFLRRSTASANRSITFQLGVRDQGATANIVTGAVETLTSDTGAYYELTWDASVLANTTGEGIGIQILQLSGGGSGVGEPQRRRIEILAIEWYADTIDAVPYLPRSYTYLV